MSEKRFVCIDIGYGDDWYITDNGKRLSEMEIVDLLNEQQALINKLQAKLREKEEDEKLYANEIVELRKTNEEWLQFKELGGDY